MPTTIYFSVPRGDTGLYRLDVDEPMNQVVSDLAGTGWAHVTAKGTGVAVNAANVAYVSEGEERSGSVQFF